MGTGHEGHKKFYILLTTIVVGAILILLLINDEGELGFLTGSTIGAKGEGDKIGEKSNLGGVSKTGRGTEIELKFDTAPKVKEETSLKRLSVIFEELNTKIRINEEELELKELGKVEMEVDDFEGEVSFDEMSVSLKGLGGKILVNGIEISTRGKMEITFNNLVYETLKIENIRLETVNFKKGDGELKVGEKMRYTLNNEDITLNSFSGDLKVGLEEGSLLVAEGEAGQVLVKGEVDLTLE